MKPIKCLNCMDRFEELEEYLRHNAEHDVDHGVTFESPSARVVAE